MAYKSHHFLQIGVPTEHTTPQSIATVSHSLWFGGMELRSISSMKEPLISEGSDRMSTKSYHKEEDNYTLFGMDPDDMFAFSTPKQAKIRSWKLTELDAGSCTDGRRRETKESDTILWIPTFALFP